MGGLGTIGEEGSCERSMTSCSLDGLLSDDKPGPQNVGDAKGVGVRRLGDLGG